MAQLPSSGLGLFAGFAPGNSDRQWERGHYSAAVFMKQNSFGTALISLTGLVVLVAVCLCYGYVQNIRKSRRLQKELIGATMNRNRAQALAADAQEFAKKNKQMDALLQSMNRPPAAAVTNATPMIAR